MVQSIFKVGFYLLNYRWDTEPHQLHQTGEQLQHYRRVKAEILISRVKVQNSTLKAMLMSVPEWCAFNWSMEVGYVLQEVVPLQTENKLGTRYY